MSTKFFYGCRAPRTVDLYDLVEGIRDAATTLHLRLEAETVARGAASVFDIAAAFGSDKKISPLIDGCTTWDNLKAEHAILRESFLFSARILRGSDHYYILPDFQNEGYLSVLTSVEGVEHYPYWDNTDRPSDVSDEEWGAVRDNWFSVPGIEYGGPWGKHGVLVDLDVHESSLVNLLDKVDAVVAQQPSVLDRKERVLSKAVNDILSEPGMPAGPGSVLSHTVTGLLMRDFLDVVTGLLPLTVDQMSGKDQPVAGSVVLDREAIRKVIDAELLNITK